MVQIFPLIKFLREMRNVAFDFVFNIKFNYLIFLNAILSKNKINIKLEHLNPEKPILVYIQKIQKTLNTKYPFS